MFGQIAGRYDLMNRIMTLGQDQSWRRYSVEQAAVPGGGLVLDVATGTGDLAIEAQRAHPDAKVVGVDIVPEMLTVARGKIEAMGRRLPLLAGDALRLPFRDNTFHSIVTAFAMRNVVDIPATFAEMARVCRPGGRVVCLEIAKPKLPIFRRIYGLYFYYLVPLLGGWIAGERSAYTYLPHSLTAFLTPDEIVEVMQAVGWRAVRYRRMMLGTVAVHVGTKGAGD
jgi:demethylmenaquinone methyltransferase/2-methoxy-6-polyprenyl-1,4-benzoquinol methylase